MPSTKKVMWMCYALGAWARNNRVGDNSWLQTIFPDLAHGDGTTFVFADGHAARMRMGLAWAPVGYTNLWMDKDPGR